MQELIRTFSKEALSALIRARPGELKLGEKIQLCGNDWPGDLKNSSCRFVLFGIPEDIGVRANQGRGGAHTAWKPALESFLNQQDNEFIHSADILLLGEVNVDDLMEACEGKTGRDVSDLDFLKQQVARLDERVTLVMKAVVESGKTALVIGGGHNNAYGNIKGASMAIKAPLNVLNCDPHLDFRSLEGRHSGNGFRYAFEEKFLGRYAVLGMHEQYNNRAVMESFRANADRVYSVSYEDIFVREKVSFQEAIQHCLSFLGQEACAVEIDMDAITNVPSSAKTSSGVSPLEARQFVYRAALDRNCVYLHIAEAAPVLSHIKADNKTGKLIAYLLSDFIKGVREREMA